MGMDMDKDMALFIDVTGSNSELAVQYLQLADIDVMDAMGEYFENFGAPLTDDPEFRRKTRAAGIELDDDKDDTSPK